MSLTYLLSSPQAAHNMKHDQPSLIRIHELYLRLIRDEKEIVLVWVTAWSCGFTITRHKWAVDSAAKGCTDGEISEASLDLRPDPNK